jgi:hypothetical protein
VTDQNTAITSSLPTELNEDCHNCVDDFTAQNLLLCVSIQIKQQEEDRHIHHYFKLILTTNSHAK